MKESQWMSVNEGGSVEESHWRRVSREGHRRRVSGGLSVESQWRKVSEVRSVEEGQ